MKKRILSILLSVVLLLTLLPTTVFATDPAITTWDELQAAFNAAPVAGEFPVVTTIKLTQNLTAESGAEALTIPANRSIVLDLNGYVLNRNVIDASGQGKASELGVSNRCAICVDEAQLTIIDSNEGNQQHKFTKLASGLWVLNEETGTETVTGGVITGGYSDNGYGGAINFDNATAFASLTIKGGNIVGNYAALNGGAIYYRDASDDTKGLFMTGGLIAGNVANKGGGIYLDSDFTSDLSGTPHEDTPAQFFGGTITENVAETGAGIYACYAFNGCIASGTMITLADGTAAPVETLSVGDEVRVFDHETGESTTAPIGIIYSYGYPKSGAYTMHFSGGVDVTALGEYTFFEKDANTYVTFTPANAASFIGHSFYDLDNDCWRELLSVTKHDTACNAYAVYSQKYGNIMASGMLSCEGYFASALCNPFKLDENKKIIPELRDADIAEWGLFTYEEQHLLTREAFDMFPFKYLNIAIGKGLTSMEEVEWVLNEYGGKVGILAPKRAPLMMLKAPSVKAPATVEQVNAIGMYVGGTIQVYGNHKSQDPGDSNMYLNGSTIHIGTEGNAPALGMYLGLTIDGLSETQAVASYSGSEQYFFSDDPNYYFEVKDDQLVIHEPADQYGIRAEVGDHAILYLDKQLVDAAGDTVTVTPYLEENYEIESMSYIGEGDVEPTVITKDAGTGKYQFSMPAKDVVVSATFNCTLIPGPTPPPTGNTSHTTLWVMLLGLSAAGLCVSFILGKKRKNAQ